MRRLASMFRRASHCLATTAFLTASLTCVWKPCNAATVPFTRHVLSSGTVLLVSEQRTVPMVVVQVLLDAGSRRDPRNKEGLASLTADVLTEGTKKRSATRINEEIDFLGARLSTSADVDFAQAGLTVLSKHLDAGLDILFDILLHPSFPEAEVERRREAALAAMTAEQDNPGQLAYRRFLELVFGNTPYGHPPIGTMESVRRLRRGDVMEFYRRYYRPANAIVAVTGDVSTPEIVDRFERAFAEWNPGRVADFVYPEIPSTLPSVAKIDKPLTQTNLILGHRGVSRDNPDFYAITVMNFILGGGGFTSRLVESVRVQGGLAYSVASQFTANKAPGTFQVSLQTKNASAGEAITRVCSEIRRIREEPVSEEELSNAQLYLTGSFPLRLDSNTKIASFLAQVEFFQLGADYAEQYIQRIRAVTREDVLRAARTYLHPADLRLVAVGNLRETELPDRAPCAEGP